MDIKIAKSHLRMLGFTQTFESNSHSYINHVTKMRIFLNGKNMWRVSHYSARKGKTQILVRVLNGC